MELSGIRYLDDLEVAGRRVFCRVDFNVPLEGGKVADDTRIRAALPTINHLREAGARVVLASHLGRPKGQVAPALSLEPAAARLAELLDTEVRFVDDCVGDGVARVVKELPAEGVAVLENLRFHAAEKKGESDFAKLLAKPFDVYVNDAFGTCHRAHASMVTMVRHFEERAAGFLVKKEIQFLGQLVTNPAQPFVAVLGGAKVSDKIGVIESLLTRCDTLLIGGAMAYTLLLAQGVAVGSSRVEADKVELARDLLAAASQHRAEIILPSDHVVASSIDASSGTITDGAAIPEGLAGFDIGPKTRARFDEVIRKAKTVFWNGPLGVFEREPFATGTFDVAHTLAASDATSVIGGGDSARAAVEAGVFDQISHVSTGGGASLKFVEDVPLPGIEVLRAGHEFGE